MIDHGYQTRTWEELKAETLARAERGAYPVFAIKPDDARAALAMIHDLDPDAWGGAWMAVGDRFMERAQEAEASDASAAAQHYLYAWRLYTFGRWPVMSAPNKRASYDKAQAAFAAYGRLVTPTIEPLSIPFEGKTIKAWLQKPAGVARPPVTINIGGSDLWKDSVAIQARGLSSARHRRYRRRQARHRRRAGSGAAGLRAHDLGDHRLFADAQRSRRQPRHRARAELGQLLVGARRLCRGRAAQGRGVPERAGAPLFPARMAAGGVQDQGVPVRLRAVAAAHARRAHGRGGVRRSCRRCRSWIQDLIEQPTPPMLLITGAKDTQVPFSDFILMMEHGSPKDAWVNPQGQTMGRSLTVKDDDIFRDVVVPWVKAAI